MNDRLATRAARRVQRVGQAGSALDSPLVLVAAAIATAAALVLLTLHAPEDTAPRDTSPAGTTSVAD